MHYRSEGALHALAWDFWDSTGLTSEMTTGIMTTPPLLQFYETVLNGPRSINVRPHNVQMVIADPASMGPKGGIIVDQKRSPTQLGRLRFLQVHKSVWDIKTINISRFHFDSPIWSVTPAALRIDDTEVEVPANPPLTELSFSRSSDGSWTVRTSPKEYTYVQLIFQD